MSAEAVLRSLVNARSKKAMLSRISFISEVCDGRGKGKTSKYRVKKKPQLFRVIVVWLDFTPYEDTCGLKTHTITDG